jgi:hypothetical protein
VTPDDSNLLVTNWNGNQLQVVRVADGAILQSPPNEAAPAYPQIAPDRTVTVGNFEGKSVSFYKLR